MNNISEPVYFEKGFAEDHRGSLEFYNDIKLDEFKRFYICLLYTSTSPRD